MKPKSSPQSRVVVVREVPIELCAFLKFGGLADSGGAAKQLIAEGGVLLNGVVETRKRKQLAAGDRVTVGSETITVSVGESSAAASPGRRT
jgi:ribosome-associated protein